MKRIIIKHVILAAIIITISSCTKDFLDVPLKGRLSTDVFPADQAVTGCYSVLLSTDIAWSLWGAWPNFLLGNVMSDDAWKGGNSDGDQPEMGMLERFEVLPSNGNSAGLYRTFYHYIFIFNTTLDGLNKSELNDSLRNKYIGEVKFLRALTYTKLMMAFGSKKADLGLVIVDHPLRQDEVGKIPRSNFNDTWDFIIEDLKFGEMNLPTKSQYPQKDLGRATKGAAQSMIARAYLYKGDMANCEAYSKKIMDTNSYFLESDFKNVFSKSNKNGKESIFEIAYTIDNYFGIVGYDFSHGSWWAAAQQPIPNGWGVGAFTKDLLNEFTQDPGDPRIIWSFVFGGDFDISNGVNDTLFFTSGLDPDKLHNRKLWDPRKFWMSGQTDNNYMVIRYADILLMYAEAANENGKPTEALAALNSVRKRARESSISDPYRVINGYNFPLSMAVSARAPDVTFTDKALLRQAIWHERRVELAGEDLRYFDLVRQGRAGTVLRAFAQKYNTLKGKGFVDGKHESMPLSQEELEGSRGIIVQNPGY